MDFQSTSDSCASAFFSKGSLLPILRRADVSVQVRNLTQSDSTGSLHGSNYTIPLQSTPNYHAATSTVRPLPRACTHAVCLVVHHDEYGISRVVNDGGWSALPPVLLAVVIERLHFVGVLCFTLELLTPLVTAHIPVASPIDVSKSMSESRDGRTTLNREIER